MACAVVSPSDTQLSLSLPLAAVESKRNVAEASFFAQPLGSCGLRPPRVMHSFEPTSDRQVCPGLSSVRAMGGFTSSSFNDDHCSNRSAVELGASSPALLSFHQRTIVRAGARAAFPFRCCAKPAKLAFGNQTAAARAEPAAKDGGDILVVKDSSARSVPSKRVTSLNERKSSKSKLASNASKVETLKLSSSDIERTRAQLEQLGLGEPALFKYMERAAPADMSVDHIVSFITSLTGIMRVSWNDVAAMLSKCPTILAVDASKLKESLDFLMDVGLDEEEAVSILANHPWFFIYDVEEMRKSVDYLVSVGLPREDVPLILQERPQALNAKAEDVKYAIECMLLAEVIPKDLTRLLTKVPDLFSPTTRKNLKSRLNFFKQVGLYGGSLGKGIARRPNLLNFDLESMKQSYNYLSEFLPPHDVAKLIRRFAEVLVIDPKRKMEPMVNHLLRLGVKPTKLGKVLLRRPQLLGYTISGLEPTLQYLKELGVTERMLGRVISISPQVLTLNCEERLKPAVEYLRSIGLRDGKDMERLLARNAQLLCCSIDKNLAPKFEYFVNIGLEKEDVIKMLVLFPSMFGQSIDLSLEPKYRYLVDVMKRSPTDIVDFPQYFGYSLEKRIKPRYERLAAKGITNLSLASMFACVESDFVSRYLVGEPPSRAPYNLRKAPRRSKYTD